MTKKVVILDIDETLVFSRNKTYGSIEFRYLNDVGMSYTKARPSARSFLEALRDRGYTLLFLTQGLVEFQIEVLRNLELLEFFQDGGIIHGYGFALPEGYSGGAIHHIIKTPHLEEGTKWVMVDNLPKGSYVVQKAGWLGRGQFTDSDYIQVEEYHGTDSDPQDLNELLPRIEAMLG